MNEDTEHRISVAYLIPLTEQQSPVTARTLFPLLMRRKILLLATVLIALAIGSAYLLVVEPLYHVEAVLEPVREHGTQRGGVSALLGEDVGALLGTNTADRVNVALSMLGAKPFLMEFIERHGLLPQLTKRTLRQLITFRKSPPTPWRGAALFKNEVLHVTENKRTGLIEVAVDWPDPVVGAQLLVSIIEEINGRLRTRQLAELETGIAYLKGELANAQSVELRQAIARVLESRLSEASLIGRREDFALTFVSQPAVPPKGEFFSPGRARVLLVSLSLGLICGMLLSLYLSLRAERRAAKTSES